MRRTMALKIACLLMCLGYGAQAWAKPARVLVVPIAGKAGPKFNAGVVNLVEPSLQKHATVLGPAVLKKALKHAHVRPPGLHAAKNIQKVGNAAGATHILIIEATGRKPHLAANTTLIDVRTGRTLVTDRYVLPKGKITPAIANQMVAPVAAKLAGGSGVGAVAADNPADAPAKPKPPAPATGQGKPPAFNWANNNNAPKEQAADTGQDPTEPHAATRAETEGDIEPDATAKADSGDDAEGEKHPKEHADRTGRARPAARLSLGIELLQRTAHITQAGLAEDKTPCYCGTGQNSNPFFPGLRLAADVYPAAFGGKGEALEGLGLQGELFATVVKSYVTDGQTTISSTLFGAKIGGVYRYVFWDSTTAPNVQLRLGYGLFNFPLAKGGFPSVSYSAPYLGLNFEVPLGIAELAFVSGFDLSLGLGTGDDVKKALSATSTQKTGSGYNALGGLRYSWNRWEFSALVRVESYKADYDGKSKLQIANGDTLTNASLSDKYLELLFNMGMVF